MVVSWSRSRRSRTKKFNVWGRNLGVAAAALTSGSVSSLRLSLGEYCLMESNHNTFSNDESVTAFWFV